MPYRVIYRPLDHLDKEYTAYPFSTRQAAELFALALPVTSYTIEEIPCQTPASKLPPTV